MHLESPIHHASGVPFPLALLRFAGWGAVLGSSSPDRHFARGEAVLWLRVLEHLLCSLIGLSERGIRMLGSLEVVEWRHWEAR